MVPGDARQQPTDVYADRRVTPDLAGSHDCTRNVKFYALVRNLTDAPLRFCEGANLAAKHRPDPSRTVVPLLKLASAAGREHDKVETARHHGRALTRHRRLEARCGEIEPAAGGIERSGAGAGLGFNRW